jgi:hypothetical protein
MESIFQIPKGDNLVTYYMLPLVMANKRSFGRHFNNSYIDKQGLKVYVELKSNMQSPLYRSNPNYITELIVKNVLFIQFVMPSRFIQDSNFFIRGKYSKMSKEAKKIIYQTSTLPYNANMGSFTVSHPILQALDKTVTLRTFLSNTIGSSLDENAELMEAPGDSWFIEDKIKHI